MNLISPFQGIRLIDTVKYRNLSFINEDDTFEKKVLQIIKGLSKNILYKDPLPCYYCCRVSNGIFSSTGLVAKINLINIKNISQHETCIISKEKEYISCFKKHMIQINPIIVGHEVNSKIYNCLHNVTKYQSPNLIIINQEIKYELWVIKDIELITEAYGSINKLWVADGHHRINALLKLDKNLPYTAILIPLNQLYSKYILRIYNNLNDKDKVNLFDHIKKYFQLHKLNNLSQLNKLQHFIIKIDDELYLLQEKNNNSKNAILEFLNQELNYNSQGNINFKNLGINLNELQALLLDKSQIKPFLIIPAFKLSTKIQNTERYPPHSSWIEPKLPDGLISFFLNESVQQSV